MPNVDFERARLVRRFTASLSSIDLDSPVFAYRLLSQKALIDTWGEEIITINFMDTLRPELWCVEGLARHLAPQTGSTYDLHMIERLPWVDAHVDNAGGLSTWVLYVDVERGQEIVDDGYFFKKVRDQLGFGSSRQIDVTIQPGMQREFALCAGSDDEGSEGDKSDLPPELRLSQGMNSVVIAACDARIAAWLFFAFACNYLDRGYNLAGYSASPGARAIFAKWDAFAFDDAYIQRTFGFAPGHQRFQDALRGQHFGVRYDAAAQMWHITPPIFRFDIIHPIDILEEYLVVTQYEEAKPAPLYVPLGTGSQTRRNALEERLVGYMQAYGARQTIGLLLDSQENAIAHMRHDTPQQLMRLENAVNKKIANTWLTAACRPCCATPCIPAHPCRLQRFTFSPKRLSWMSST